MCGILAFLILSKKIVAIDKFTQKWIPFLLSLLKNRGPDALGNEIIKLNDHQILYLIGSLLHMRGIKPVAQPLVHSLGNILLFNGEIYNGISIPINQNDSSILLSLLSTESSDDNILKVLSSILGPWSIVYYDNLSKILWFGRDCLGRKSLLIGRDKLGHFPIILSSIAYNDPNVDWLELPSVGIFSIDLSKQLYSDYIVNRIRCHPWTKDFKSLDRTNSVLIALSDFLELDFYISTSSTLISPLVPICLTVPDNDVKQIHNTIWIKNAQILLNILEASVARRISFLPEIKHINKNHSTSPMLLHNILPMLGKAKVAVLFSGGIDSSVIAAVLDKVLPPCEEIDLINLAFLQSNTNNNNNRVNNNNDNCNNNNNNNNNSNNNNNKNKNNNNNNNNFLNPSIIINKIPLNSCFSSTEDFAKNANFLNVTNELIFKEFNDFSSLSITQHALSIESYTNCTTSATDRINGYNSLKMLNQNRKWNLIEVNITKMELDMIRLNHITNCIFPLKTILDDNIGSALWLASRGLGTINCVPYQSCARIILTGMGADEQLGGYFRHRAAFERRSWDGLLSEIIFDISRISYRNLGRDDRCISDHGVEARMPYLDEEVVNFLNSLPINFKLDPILPRGEGDKKLLREVGLILGLGETTKLHKKAIQYGTNLAKINGTNSKSPQSICTLFN